MEVKIFFILTNTSNLTTKKKIERKIMIFRSICDVVFDDGNGQCRRILGAA